MLLTTDDPVVLSFVAYCRDHREGLDNSQLGGAVSRVAADFFNRGMPGLNGGPPPAGDVPRLSEVMLVRESHSNVVEHPIDPRNEDRVSLAPDQHVVSECVMQIYTIDEILGNIDAKLVHLKAHQTRLNSQQVETLRGIVAQFQSLSTVYEHTLGRDSNFYAELKQLERNLKICFDHCISPFDSLDR